MDWNPKSPYHELGSLADNRRTCSFIHSKVITILARSTVNVRFLIIFFRSSQSADCQINTPPQIMLVNHRKYAELILSGCF